MPRHKNVRLTQARDDYLEHRRKKGLSPTTIAHDKEQIDRLIHHIGDLYTVNVTAAHVEGWVYSLLEDHHDRNRRLRPGVGPRGFNMVAQRLRMFSRWCHRTGLTKQDWMIDVSDRKVPVKIRQRVQVEEMHDLIEVPSEPRDRALLALGCNTALRASEVRALRVGDVDLDGRTIRVWVQKSQIEDVLRMSDHLAAELTVWLDHYRHEIAQHRGEILSPEAYLFPVLANVGIVAWETAEDGSRRPVHGQRGYDPARPFRQVYKPVKQALAALGMETHQQGMHTLRRSVARAMFDTLNATGDDGALRTVGSLLHHSSTITTEKYLGISTEQKRRDEFLAQGLLGKKKPRDQHRGLHLA